VLQRIGAGGRDIRVGEQIVVGVEPVEDAPADRREGLAPLGPPELLVVQQRVDLGSVQSPWLSQLAVRPPARRKRFQVHEPGSFGLARS
jgi:hypothetical protein